ncbi:hypothetical protein QCA50_004953 [Cerrena zonata]|uniref:Jacalin-type lectin domain-containing protein n=1 Tax=Cerrena zonata TaxID=2478898 RepID=A0AAW0GPP7_9APHY
MVRGIGQWNNRTPDCRHHWICNRVRYKVDHCAPEFLCRSCRVVLSHSFLVMQSLFRWVSLALFLSSPVLSSPVLTTRATTSGTFNLLTYNVAGLPEILSSGDPEADTSQISPRLTNYNIVNVQEDFNYHATLYAGDDHPYRSATSGGAGIGSGLNTLSDFPFIDYERVGWDDCNLNSGDCLTPKGFTFTRVRVSEGVWVDLYDLHTDAGDEAGDITARSKNFAQLTSWINTWSAGMPFVVMGDTNSRYTRNGDADTLRNFVANTGSVDSWVQHIRGGTPPPGNTDALVCPFPFPAGTSQDTMNACETVDKFFIRGSKTLSLASTSFNNENLAFQNATGAPLSDHYPLTSNVAWTLSSSLRLGDTSGGPHGDPFNDVAGVLSGEVPILTSVTIRGGSRVDAVSFTVKYKSGSTSTASHGGTGGDAKTLNLASGEFVNSVTTCWGQKSGHTRVFYASLTTNKGNTLTNGATTSDCQTITVPSDKGDGAWGLVGFWGRSGDEIDRLGPVWGASY